MPKPAAKARPQGRPEAPKAPAPPSPLVSEILAGIEPLRKGPAGWCDRLPEDVRAEMLELRARHASGTLGCTKVALAKSIHAALAERGLIAIGWKEIVRWIGEHA